MKHSKERLRRTKPYGVNLNRCRLRSKLYNPIWEFGTSLRMLTVPALLDALL